MNKLKDLIDDFKYMNKSSQLQVIGVIVAIMAIIVGGIVFIGKKEEPQQTIQLDLNDYRAYAYQGTGDISLINLNDNKSIKKVTVEDVNKDVLANKEIIEKYQFNPYKLVEANDKIYALNFKGQIVEFEYSIKDLKELRRINTQKNPIDFKIYSNMMYVSYINSTRIDVINLDSGNTIRTFEANSNVTSFELIDNELYIGSIQGIEIIDTTDITKKNFIKLDEEAISTEILGSAYEEELVVKEIKSESKTAVGTQDDKNEGNNKDKDDDKKKTDKKEVKKVKTVYVANTFGNDNKTSVIFKIQEGKPVDLIDLKRENPIKMTENEKFLYVVCRGLENDKGNDYTLVINKKLFKVKNKITMSDKPNDLYEIDESIAYISHDSGEVIRVNLEDESSETNYTIPSIKGIIVKKYGK